MRGIYTSLFLIRVIYLVYKTNLVVIKNIQGEMI